MNRFSRTTTPRRVLATAAIVGLAATLAACATPASSTSADCAETYTIGYSNPTSEAAAVKTLIEKLKVAATANGCVDLLVDNTQGGDLETQRATLESWVTQEVDAIVVAPVDASAVANLQKTAQEQGTKWLTYAFPAEGTDGYAGFDNAKSGELVGEAAVTWLAETYPDGGVTAAVTTLTPLPAVSGRWDEPIAALEGAGVEIVSQQDCASQTCGLEIAESLLQANPDLRIFIGFNDDAALGAAKAFANAGIDPSEVFIGGQDGSREALEAVKAGTMNITAAILQDALAQSILDAALHAITGEGETDLEAEVVPATADDQASLDELIAQFD
jgi:ABC-type sugar transport system substrate-binding protein